MRRYEIAGRLRSAYESRSFTVKRGLAEEGALRKAISEATREDAADRAEIVACRWPLLTADLPFRGSANPPMEVPDAYPHRSPKVIARRPGSAPSVAPIHRGGGKQYAELGEVMTPTRAATPTPCSASRRTPKPTASASGPAPGSRCSRASAWTL